MSAMETNNKRPSAALINREWFDAARSIMSVQDLGIVLVRACEYVFGSETFDIGGEVQKVVFAMIKPALDSDIAKYNERCARNAANARSHSQRVEASGIQSQRVGANTTTTSTTTTTTTSTTNPSLSIDQQREIEKFLIYGYFWSTGSKAVADELSAFWSYYESLGWKNNKGAEIVSKVAAARMWRRQYETGNVPNGADAWYKALQSCPVPDVNVWKGFAGAEKIDDTAIVRTRFNSKFIDDLRSAVPTLERSLCSFWRVSAVRWEQVP